MKPAGILRRSLPALLCLGLASGWAAREIAHAREHADQLKSKTMVLGQLKMEDYLADGKKVGKIGIYLAGDTPKSTQFVTGRFVLDAGQSPHAPHTHAEEEVMVIESGTGEIVCDGETTAVGPGSVMFTTPNVSHGIVNTGSTPLVFYFIKWAPAAK
ncbi:MAG: cupin domain-containing protein [Isosphaeraceae bacterium]